MGENLTDHEGDESHLIYRMDRVLGPVTGMITILAAVVSVITILTAPPTTDFQPSPADDPIRFLEPDSIPEIYSGELVDVNGDEQPDFVVFGSSSEPVVQTVGGQASNSPLYIALVTSVLLLCGQLFGPMVGAWAKQRWAVRKEEGSGE